MKVIADAYNRHQIPQDVAKKLVYFPKYCFKLFGLMSLKCFQRRAAYSQQQKVQLMCQTKHVEKWAVDMS